MCTTSIVCTCQRGSVLHNSIPSARDNTLACRDEVSQWNMYRIAPVSLLEPRSSMPRLSSADHDNGKVPAPHHAAVILACLLAKLGAT